MVNANGNFKGIVPSGNVVDRLSLADLRQGLNDRLETALGERFGKLDIVPLSSASDVEDGTTVSLLRNETGRSCAVILSAAPASPDMVRRAMSRARKAKLLLGPSLGLHILDPLLEGNLCGLSYAVMPYCNSLSNFRPLWWVQRTMLCPSIFEWLRSVTECTVRDVEQVDIERKFIEPLREVAAFKLLGGRVRATAERAVERLYNGEWSPKYVLMHSDFWKGNILIQPGVSAGEKQLWRDRFVIIDWPGSEMYGYAFFDLLRMSQSMRLNSKNLRKEVASHCQLLKCKKSDSMSYLLAALGHIAMNLEYFPVETYIHMAQACVSTLEEVLD